MNINSDENPFFINDIDNHINQNPLMEIIKNLYKQGQFDFDFNFLNNFPTIELEEDKEEERRKRDKLFMKSFKEVFGLNDSDFIDNEIDEDDDDEEEEKEEDDEIYFQNKKESDRKKGRPKKGEILGYEVKKDKFDKFLTLHKIIRCLFKNALNHINKTYEATNEEKKSGPLLRSVDAEEYNVYSNQKIVELFNKTLGDVFSAKISRRNFNFISEHSEDNNKIVIESLKKENKEKKVIEILDLTVREFHEKYINNEIDGFTFENDLIKIEKKEGIEYKNRYEKIALELIDIIDKKGEKIKNK